jgi:hypothetical protein
MGLLISKNKVFSLVALINDSNKSSVRNATFLYDNTSYFFIKKEELKG